MQFAPKKTKNAAEWLTSPQCCLARKLEHSFWLTWLHLVYITIHCRLHYEFLMWH